MSTAGQSTDLWKVVAVAAIGVFLGRLQGSFEAAAFTAPQVTSNSTAIVENKQLYEKLRAEIEANRVTAAEQRGELNRQLDGIAAQLQELRKALGVRP